MLINISGWPGVGKLTTGRELRAIMGGRLLDNHTILNVGYALAEGGTSEYYELVRAVRSAAFTTILKLPSTLPVILTSVVARGGTSGFLEENWQAIIDLARARDCPLFSVTLMCSPAENTRRIVSEDRGNRGKSRKAEILDRLVAERSLFDDGATHRTTIDNTNSSAQETAQHIQDWIETFS